MEKELENKIKVLYKTDSEAVVYKPAGIATQLSNDIKGTSLEAVLKKLLHKENIYFPHRLDRITSGLILIAFDPKTVNFYNDEIKSKKFDKYYIARIETKLEYTECLLGTHKRYIKVEGKISRIVKRGGMVSFLDILAIEKTPKHPGCYHVLIRLITGRMHQIRVMLSDIGIPLCGDHLYNPESKSKHFYLESIILSFEDTGKIERTIFYDDNPDRDVFSAEMNRKIESIASE
ncbi:MAG: RNA pseudouridine synthase [Candidatus Delongbacteria bacterium]|nr:RNA pseudouridine synthase [Candidatus Delongbacteria bacterium]MCG2761207.1 RNA pseudouridine synthase [Candidatus Delongbacteria bacterium]